MHVIHEVVDAHQDADCYGYVTDRLSGAKIDELEHNSESKVHKRNFMEVCLGRVDILQVGAKYLTTFLRLAQKYEDQQRQIGDDDYSNLNVTIDQKNVGETDPSKAVFVEHG